MFVRLGALLFLVFGVAFLALDPPLHAQRGPRATLFITQTRIPRGLTERALLGFARRSSARTMTESTEEELNQRHWRGSLVIGFSSPPSDLEFHGLFYDITDGTQNFVSDMAIYIHDRSQRTFVQRLDLARPQFRPNRRMELVLTMQRAEAGRVRFELRGEEPRRSGRVDFTEEETRRQAGD